MFDLQAPFQPSGDQPQAIDALIRSVETGQKMQALPAPEKHKRHRSLSIKQVV
jgi:excinuclease UvrABC helicase subunit UvrB